jgi:hypothetical protein
MGPTTPAATLPAEWKLRFVGCNVTDDEGAFDVAQDWANLFLARGMVSQRLDLPSSRCSIETEVRVGAAALEVHQCVVK